MRVSFDLDDTAWKYREVCRQLAHALVAAGHQVGILTGHEDAHKNAAGVREGTAVREADLNLWVARGFPPAAFLLNATDCQRAGIPWHGAPQREWKLTLAVQSGIDLHIDDFGTGERIEFVPLGQRNQSQE